MESAPPRRWVRPRSAVLAGVGACALVALVALVRLRELPASRVRFHATSDTLACCKYVDDGMMDVIDCRNHTHKRWCQDLCSHQNSDDPPPCFRAHAVPTNAAPIISPELSVGAPMHTLRTEQGYHLCPQRGSTARSYPNVQASCNPAYFGRHGGHCTKVVHWIPEPDQARQTSEPGCTMTCIDPAGTNHIGLNRDYGASCWAKDGCCPPQYTRPAGYTHVTQFSATGHSLGIRHSLRFVIDPDYPLFNGTYIKDGKPAEPTDKSRNGRPNWPDEAAAEPDTATERWKSSRWEM